MNKAELRVDCTRKALLSLRKTMVSSRIKDLCEVTYLPSGRPPNYVRMRNLNISSRRYKTAGMRYGRVSNAAVDLP